MQILKNEVVNVWGTFGNLFFKNKKMYYLDQIKAALFGVAVGDAVGVPFEFSSREEMQQNPATEMIGYGSYNQPPGTWSDDSSLTFCLADALATHGYSLHTIAFNFHMWRTNAWWSARNEVFDIGNLTSQAITRLFILLENENYNELTQLKYSGNEFENGNGSLMRIIPLLFYIKVLDPIKQFDIVWEISALTHRHIRAAMSCFIYLNLAENILNGCKKEEAYDLTRKTVTNLWKEIDFSLDEQTHFHRLIQTDIRETRIEDLKSGGYVIEVLESSIWFFLNKNNYRDTILSIINIGHDTDTSAAIAGGLAGIYYGYEGIPDEWVNNLARKEDIEHLAERLAKKLDRQ